MVEDSSILIFLKQLMRFDVKNMSRSNEIRIYELARELKQDTKRVIEDLRREGADVSVPSNYVSKELAKKIRNKHVSKTDFVPKQSVKIIKKGTKTITTLNTKSLINLPKGQEICEFCSVTISAKDFSTYGLKIKYYTHVLSKCQKIPFLSEGDILKYFNRMKDIANTINKTKFNSVDFASYLIDSESISKLESASYPPICNYFESNLRADINKGKKKLKVVIIKELFISRYPPNSGIIRNNENVNLGINTYRKTGIDNYVSRNGLSRFFPENINYFETILKFLKEIAKFYVQTVKKIDRAKELLLHSDKSNQNIIKVEEIDWEIFPRGNWLTKKEIVAKIYEYFTYLQNKDEWKNGFFDKSRMENIEERLNPNKCFIGKDKFESYIVYCFDWTDKVILECPIYGNATYVIKPGEFTWKDIAKESKWDVRTEHSDQVTVINHSETWIERLEQNLRYGL